MNCWRHKHKRRPNADGLPVDPPSTPQYNGDPRFTLSAEETRWCEDLKEALTAAGVPIPQPDLLLAQFAIVGKGKTRKAVKRVRNFQKVIEGEYGYSREKAVAAGHFMNEKWPGMVLAAQPLPTGEPVFAVNVLPYRPSEMDWHTEWAKLVVEFVLLMDAVNCDLECIRKGGSMVVHMKGMGWHNFNLKMEEKAAPLYQEAYPCRFHSFPLVDAGPIATVIMRLVRAFLKKKIAERMIICKQEDLYSPKYGYKREGLPPVLGGTFDRPLSEFVAELLARRAEAERRVVVTPAATETDGVAPSQTMQCLQQSDPHGTGSAPAGTPGLFEGFCGCGNVGEG